MICEMKEWAGTQVRPILLHPLSRVTQNLRADPETLSELLIDQAR